MVRLKLLQANELKAATANHVPSPHALGMRVSNVKIHRQGNRQPSYIPCGWWAFETQLRLREKPLRVAHANRKQRFGARYHNGVTSEGAAMATTLIPEISSSSLKRKHCYDSHLIQESPWKKQSLCLFSGRACLCLRDVLVESMSSQRCSCVAMATIQLSSLKP